MQGRLAGFEWVGTDRLSGAFGLLLVAALAGLALHWVLVLLFSRLAQRSASPLGAMLLHRLGGPFRMLLPLLAVTLVWPPQAFPAPGLEAVNHLLSLLIISSVTWLFMGGALMGQDLILSRFDLDVQDNLKARAVHTQLNLLVRIVLVAITVIAGAAMLMTFDRIRHVGVSIFASAGVIGIILGFAAQRSIATLFAGLQIAFTQPIRIGDAVLVEGEWGWVEDITLTYVVIKIWDLRRLVVPVTYFLEKPFQNWTRSSADLLGTVFLYVDYTVPLDAVRQRFRELLQASAKWDGKVSVVQVTNCTERTMELRLLMSAADSPKAFDLRCEVREGLLTFLQERHPGSLPKVRADVVGVAPTSPGSA